MVLDQVIDLVIIIVYWTIVDLYSSIPDSKILFPYQVQFIL